MTDEQHQKTTILLYDDGNGITLTAAPNGVMTILMNRGPNVFNPSLIGSLMAALRKVEDVDHPKALVIRGVGKFFSNGLDLEFMQNSEPHETSAMIEQCWNFLARLLVLDCRTVAAINGHGFGAGLFLALACDFRIMRTKRGFLNFPELNLGMRLGKGFAELSKAKITSPQVLREGVLTGKRYDSHASLKAGLVDDECSVEMLQERAESLALQGLPDELGAKFFDATSFQQMKMELYSDAYRTLTTAKVESLPESRL